MYIGPWQEMHLSRVVASLRKADGAEEQRKHLQIALEAASSSRRKLRDVSGLPPGRTSTTPPPPSLHHQQTSFDASDISTASNSPVSVGHLSSISSSSSSLSHTGMSIVSGGGGGSHLESSASVAFVLGGGAKKKKSHFSTLSSSATSTTSSNIGGGGGKQQHASLQQSQTSLVPSKNTVSQVERMRKLYVSGGLGEDGDVRSELDDELALLTSISFNQNPQLQKQGPIDTATSLSPKRVVSKEDDVNSSSGMIPGTRISPLKHGQTERERRLLELIAVQAAQQEALSGQLQHQARVQAAVQNRLMTLLQDDDSETTLGSKSTKSVNMANSISASGSSGVSQSTRKSFESPTRSPTKARAISNSLLYSGSISGTLQTGSLSSSSSVGGKNASQCSPLPSDSPLVAEGGILADLEADLERLGIDVTKHDHLMAESPPPVAKQSLPVVVDYTSGGGGTAETGQTSSDMSNPASAVYMHQQQQQYMQWLQWQNYYQQQNQWYQMQMMQQQQQQQQQTDFVQPSQPIDPVEESTQSLPRQSAAEPGAWTGHASEVDRLRSIFGRKR